MRYGPMIRQTIDPITSPIMARISRARSSSRWSPRLIVVSRGSRFFFLVLAISTWRCLYQAVPGFAGLFHSLNIVKPRRILGFLHDVVLDVLHIIRQFIGAVFGFVDAFLELRQALAHAAGDFGQ